MIANGWDWRWLPTLLLFLVLCGDLILALLNVLLYPVVQMDLIVEENGLGFMQRGERWYLFLDGITSIEQRTKGLWTIQHFNGTRINIPVGAITEEQLDYLRAAAARGRRPEVIQAVIERGRRIERILAEDRRKKNT